MATWERRIDAAEKRGRFTDADHAATAWDSCAVAEQRKAHPDVVVTQWDEPLDEPLYHLGYAFARAVRGDDPMKARQVLKKIDRRVQTLARRKSKEA